MPAKNSSNKDRDGDSKKEAQKQGVKFLKAQRTGWSVTTVNQPPGELRKTASDLKLGETLASAQLAHPAGPRGRSPPLRERRHGTPICASILSAQESAPLLTGGNTRQCFPKNNEQDCFNRVHLDTTFLSYFRIIFMGRQIILAAPAPASGSLTSREQWSNWPALAEETGLTMCLPGTCSFSHMYSAVSSVATESSLGKSYLCLLSWCRSEWASLGGEWHSRYGGGGGYTGVTQKRRQLISTQQSRVWLCQLSEVNLAENRSGNSNKGNMEPALETN